MLTASGLRQTTDSVVIRETVRDTIVTVERDSALVRALVECDSLGQAHIKQLLEYESGRRLTPPVVHIRDNVLTAAAKVDSLAIYLKLKDKYKEAVRYDTRVITQTVEVNRLTGWQKTFYRLGQIFTLALLARGAFRIYKRIKR